jgi:hypothetical protein
VRERRIPKAIKPEDEESSNKGSRKEEALVILRGKIRRKLASDIHGSIMKW